MISRQRIPRAGIIVVGIFVLLYVVYCAFSFRKLFYDHAGTGLTQYEILNAYENAKGDVREPSVPRIVHRIFHNWTDPQAQSLSPQWEANRQTCIDHNPEWKHYLWTTSASRDFIRREYPWFLKTYDCYSRPIQRIDALKYFLLRHYGGIYVDLDDVCISSLEALRYYPVWVSDGARGCLSNNILGSRPHHPLWILVTESLQKYAWNYPLPYITVHYGSGQWFETAIWERYHGRKVHEELTRVMMDDRPGAEAWLFFRHTSTGGTWDDWDNELMRWAGDNVQLAILIGAASVVLAISILWRILRLVVSMTIADGLLPSNNSLAHTDKQLEPL